MKAIDVGWTIVGADRKVGTPCPLSEPVENGFMFCNDPEMLTGTETGVIVTTHTPSTAQKDVTYVLSDNPKLMYIRALRGLLKTGSITKREIVIGKNATIHPRAIIGVDGYGGEKNEKGEYELFPQIGGVIIGDNVNIGANTTVNRGALGDTTIGDGCVIAHGNNIGHNCKLGKNVFIAGGTFLGGSSEIGDGCFISALVFVNPHVKIGSGVIIGGGSVVTKDFDGEGAVLAGSPAKVLKQSPIGTELKGMPRQ